MTATDSEPKINFSVEMGPARQPMLKVSIDEKEFPLGLTQTQAVQLGRALFAASFAVTIAQPPPEGTRITGCELPVVNWGVALSNASGLPILGLRVAGGADLIFQFDAKAAHACGTSLAAQSEKIGTVPSADTFQFE